MSFYTITIDHDACVGDKMCCEIAMDTFSVDADGHAFVVDPDGDPADDVLRAARSCYMEAISLHDAETGEKVWPSI